MRFCTLKAQYSLRGWIGMPYALKHNYSVMNLNRDQFHMLLLCDGQRDLEKTEMSNEMKLALDAFEKEDVIEYHQEPHELQPDQYYKHYDNRYFNDVIWSITGKCNCQCRHCYLDAPDAAFGELPLEEAYSIVDQMAECGIYKVDLTGGEPLVRNDFWKIVDKLCQRGIDIEQIYTNGCLLTEEVLDQLSERNLRTDFCLSFDGLGWHDWMRGVTGAEEAALSAMKLCVDKGFFVSVEMCVHKGNLSSLRDTVLKLAETGVSSIKVSDVMNTDLWLKNSEGYETTIQSYFDAILDYIPHYFEDGMPVNMCLGGVVRLRKGSTEYFPVAEFDEGTEKCLQRHICGAARSGCYIGPDGRLLPCMPIASAKEKDLFPKVQDIGLRQALKESYYMQYVNMRVKDLLEVCKTCRECPYHLKCGGGCRAEAVKGGETNLMGPDPYRCLMWKGGYLEKLHEVCDKAIQEIQNKEFVK